MRRSAEWLCAALCLLGSGCTPERALSPSAEADPDLTSLAAGVHGSLAAQIQSTRAALARVSADPPFETAAQRSDRLAEVSRLQGILTRLSALSDSVESGIIPVAFTPAFAARHLRAADIYRSPTAGPLAETTPPDSTVYFVATGTKTIVRLYNFASSSVEFDTQMSFPVMQLDAHLSGTITKTGQSVGTPFLDDANAWHPFNFPTVLNLPGSHPLDVDCQSISVQVFATTHHTAGIGSVPINGVDFPMSISTDTQDQQPCLPLHAQVTVTPSSVSVGGTATATGSVLNSNSQTMTSTCVWQWSSSNSGVANIAQFGGSITTSKAGTATITGQCNGLTGTAPLSVTLADDETCDDENADNYGEAGACTYPDTCEDSSATNYGQDGECTYPPPPATCDDPAATNYGAQADCSYPPPPDQCLDSTANNYGDAGPCDYSPPPTDPSTDPGSGGGGDPDDPCLYTRDITCDDGDAAMSIRRAPAGRAAVLTALGSQSQPYYVFLVQGWSNSSVVAMVGRFHHGGGWVDAVYLPAKAPTAQGWVYAVRALQLDRAVSRDNSGLTRVIRIGADGSESFTRGNAQTRALLSQPPLSAGDRGAAESAFNSGILKNLRGSKPHGSKKMTSIQLVRVH